MVTEPQNRSSRANFACSVMLAGFLRRPSNDAGDIRLAIEVEIHPIDFDNPQGQYDSG